MGGARGKASRRTPHGAGRCGQNAPDSGRFDRLHCTASAPALDPRPHPPVNEPPEPTPLPTPGEEQRLPRRGRRGLVGRPRSVTDPGVFDHVSLVALLAWVGLGADGLSSSSYGPEEAFKALGSHTELAIFLALGTALTVLIIAAA